MLEGRGRRLGGRRRRLKRRQRRRPDERRWWWSGGPMRAKGPRMSRLGWSSPPMVVQDLSLLLLAFVEWLLLYDLL
jgi:hypothetical protein